MPASAPAPTPTPALAPASAPAHAPALAPAPEPATPLVTAAADRTTVGLGEERSVNLLANDTTSQAGATLRIASIGGIAFNDLAFSTDSTHSAAEGFRQITLEHGTAYIKDDGTVFYRHEGRSVLLTPNDTGGTFERRLPDGSVQTLAVGQTVKIGMDEIASGRLRYQPASAEVGTASTDIAVVQELTAALDNLTYTVTDGSGATAAASLTLAISGDPPITATAGDGSGQVGSGATDQDRDGILANVENTLASRARGLSAIEDKPYTITLDDLLRLPGSGDTVVKIEAEMAGGDLNFDGIRDSDQNAVTTFAWINKSNYDLANTF